MKFYYAKGACSIGIHVLLEEIGKPYEEEVVTLSQPAPERPLTQVNPKSKVPTLVRDDGSVLTEFVAIATWLAQTNPEARLMPEGADATARAYEALDYAVATMHMQAFTRLFRPGNFAPSEADHDAVKARGRELATKGFAIMDRELEGKEYVVGDYTIGDLGLFYVEFWAGRLGIELPGHCAAHFARMKARPAVARVLAKEGFA